MNIISSLFKRPRLYDDNWQMETVNINVNNTFYDWVVPFEYNIHLLSVYMVATTVSGIRNATDHFRIDCFDGGRKIFQSIPYTNRSSTTFKITWQAGIAIPAATTAFDSRYIALPDFIFLKGGQVLSLFMNHPLAGDNISIMNITFKRWKI